MEISGEVDMVKPSPRETVVSRNLTKTSSLNKINSNGIVGKNGNINLTQDQLMALLTALNNKNGDSKQNGANDNLNLNLNLGDGDYKGPSRPQPVPRQSRPSQYDDEITIYRPPAVIIASDDEYESPTRRSTNNLLTKASSLNNLDQIVQPSSIVVENSNKTSLMDKKRLKWQQDKGIFIHKNQYKFFSNIFNFQISRNN